MRPSLRSDVQGLDVCDRIAGYNLFHHIKHPQVWVADMPESIRLALHRARL